MQKQVTVRQWNTLRDLLWAKWMFSGEIDYGKSRAKFQRVNLNGQLWTMEITMHVDGRFSLEVRCGTRLMERYDSIVWATARKRALEVYPYL